MPDPKAHAPKGLKDLKKGRGGARPGAGMPKGHKTHKTLAKEQAREVARALITAQLEPLIQAQLHNAMGIGHLMLRDRETGKFERVVTTGDSEKDKAVIDAAIGTGNACWIYLKDPSVQAFTDLLNRALDKPKDQAQAVDVNIKGELKSKSDAEILAALAGITKKLTKDAD